MTVQYPSDHAPAADTVPPRGRASRNLIICCDGTGNVLGNQHDTNVVRLVRLCAKDEQQCVYYDPGVGTNSGIPPVDFLDRVNAKLGLLLGLAFGRGIYENVAQAYEFLVHNYRPGDRIFLFGFSRGAFTVRCVSGLVHTYGIVRPCAAPLMPLMLRNYFAPTDQQEDSKKSRSRFANDIRTHFTDEIGERAEIHFIGVWDTVASVGGLRSIDFSTDPSLKGKPYRYVRHAVAEGEYRAKYAPRIYEGGAGDEPSGEGAEREASLKQLWFPGVHSDVGGSYDNPGLSHISLEWMLNEAQPRGLRLVPDAASMPDFPRPDVRTVAHDQALVSPLWALTGLQRRSPPPRDAQHPSLAQRAGDAQLELEPRLRFPRHRWFWYSLAAWLATLVASVHSAGWIGPTSLSATKLAQLQLSAPWIEDAERLQHADHLGWPLVLAALCVLASTGLACTLTVYAIRSLRSFKPASEPTHELFRRVSSYGLRAFLAGGLFESGLTCLFFTHARALLGPVPVLGAHSAVAVLLALASAAKWLAAIAVLVLCLFAALHAMFAKKPQVPRGASARSPAE